MLIATQVTFQKKSNNLLMRLNSVYLCEQHERVVGRQVPLEKVYAVLLEGRHGVLLGRVEGRHHGLGADLHIVAEIKLNSLICTVKL